MADWQPDDDPLANLPEPVGAAVTQWRREGLSDAKIRSLLNSSWLASPAGAWQPGLSELRRRDAVTREHEAAGARRLSDALDAALTAEQSNTPTSPLETPLTPSAGLTPRARDRQTREAALNAYRASAGAKIGADAQYEDYNGRYRTEHPTLPKLARAMFRPEKPEKSLQNSSP